MNNREIMHKHIQIAAKTRNTGNAVGQNAYRLSAGPIWAKVGWSCVLNRCTGVRGRPDFLASSATHSPRVGHLVRKPTAPKTVRLGVPEDFAGRRLIDLLSGFSAASPQIRLDTTSGWSVELRRQLDAGEIDLALIKREAGDGPCLASWTEELVWVGSANHSVHSDPVALAVFPVGCIYRERAIHAMEAEGRRWRIAYTSQGLMGVQAAVASGLGISLLPIEAVLSEHRKLEAFEGFQTQRGSELALVKGRLQLSAEAKLVADFFADVLTSAISDVALGGLICPPSWPTPVEAG